MTRWYKSLYFPRYLALRFRTAIVWVLFLCHLRTFFPTKVLCTTCDTLPWYGSRRRLWPDPFWKDITGLTSDANKVSCKSFFSVFFPSVSKGKERKGKREREEKKKPRHTSTGFHGGQKTGHGETRRWQFVNHTTRAGKGKRKNRPSFAFPVVPGRTGHPFRRCSELSRNKCHIASSRQGTADMYLLGLVRSHEKKCQ